MTHKIELTDELFARLQRHAVPLIDTPLTIIERALDALEQGDEDALMSGGDEPRSFNPAAPPNLAHTNVLSATVEGRKLPRSECYWNQILFAVIVEAVKKGVSKEDIFELAKSNHVDGKKEGSGWYFLPEADHSVQGTSAPYAWKQTYTLASSVGIAVDVSFAWQDTEKAEQPLATGTLHVEGAR